ncbi:g1933 [Coccomyxa elongata]
MAVFRQKRKNIEEPPQPFALETSGSCASTLSGVECFGGGKRRRTDQDASMQSQDYQQQPAAYLNGYFFGQQHHPASSPVLDHPLSPLHPSSSIAGSSCGFTYATDSAASPQPSTSGPPQTAWNMSEQQPAASFASGESFQHSSAGEQNEVAMQAQTPHSQVHQASRFAFQPGLALNRSNSAPDLRVLLAGPVNAVPQAVLLQQPQPFGGSSTAFALVPYKAPEGSMLF